MPAQDKANVDPDSMDKDRTAGGCGGSDRRDEHCPDNCPNRKHDARDEILSALHRFQASQTPEDLLETILSGPALRAALHLVTPARAASSVSGPVFHAGIGDATTIGTSLAATASDPEHLSNAGSLDRNFRTSDPFYRTELRTLFLRCAGDFELFLNLVAEQIRTRTDAVERARHELSMAEELLRQLSPHMDRTAAGFWNGRDAWLYHATPRRNLEAIRRDGLLPGSYWGTRTIADYYAEDISDNGDDPILLRISTERVLAFRPAVDGPGIEEPLTFTLGTSEEKVWSDWTASPRTWQDCFILVGSLRLEAAIPFAAVDIEHT